MQLALHNHLHHSSSTPVNFKNYRILYAGPHTVCGYRILYADPAHLGHKPGCANRIQYAVTAYCMRGPHTVCGLPHTICGVFFCQPHTVCGNLANTASWMETYRQNRIPYAGIWQIPHPGWRNIGKTAYRMRKFGKPHPGVRLSPHTVCEIPHTPDLLSDPHILGFGEPHIVCGFGLHFAYSMQYPAHLPRNSPAYSMRYPHTVCGNFGSLPLGGKKGKPHPGIKAKSASRMPRAGDDRIRYAVILEVYYDIFWRAWPPLQCAVGVAAEHTGAWVPRHITNPVLLLTPRSESEHMCVCVCVEIYITHS
jgi:hypothetical protein